MSLNWAVCNFDQDRQRSPSGKWRLSKTGGETKLFRQLRREYSQRSEQPVQRLLEKQLRGHVTGVE